MIKNKIPKKKTKIIKSKNNQNQNLKRHYPKFHKIKLFKTLSMTHKHKII